MSSTLATLLKDRVFKPGKGGLFFLSRGVANTPELRRIVDIPRRKEVPASAVELTTLLQKPDGSMFLRPIQAQALDELYRFGGMFGPIVVGGGKTLISFLAPLALDAKRPLLLIPANLKEKTKRDFAVLAKHWQGEAIPYYSYELLGRATGLDILTQINPDVIIADECHRLKNRKAACTRRVTRWMDEHPQTRFVAMSGTVTSRSLKDFAHILEWCFPDFCPLPTRWGDLLEWCLAVDEKADIRIGPGALRILFDEQEKLMLDTTQAARSAVRRRITETPGVVATSDVQIGSSLIIRSRGVRYKTLLIDELFAAMRSSWLTPGGEPIADPVSFWRHCRELCLGFYYIWDPPAPLDWLAARSAWAKCCRHILEHNRTNLDSEFPVVMAVKRGEYDGKTLYKDGMPLTEDTVDVVYQRWADIRPSFEPNVVPVWEDLSVVQFCEQWASQNRGLVWVEHRAFGLKLQEVSGMPYFANGGIDNKTKIFIEDWKPADGSAIVSIASNSEGRNLQAWSQALVTSPPSTGRVWEQLLGRLHRQGQEEDEVYFDVLNLCKEQEDGFKQAREDAKYIESGQQKQKLNYASIIENGKTEGPRWPI